MEIAENCRQMKSTIAPEEIELNKKKKVLDRLKDKLADAEEEIADLRAELDLFEGRYKIEVARFYHEFDEIEAEIAEEEAKLVPDDEEIKKRAEELRRRAEESVVDESNIHCGQKWTPTVEAKKAYHNLARIIHPDLALDATEKERRHELMAKLNEAYSAGDQSRLNKLVEDFRDSPDLVRGDTPGDELVRAIRQIYQIKRRMIELREEKSIAEHSELFTLREKSEAAMREGRDLLKQMAERTKTHIRKAQRRLTNLKNLNVAQEEYVRERYGMDITEFR